jgi:hypothetical protein
MQFGRVHGIALVVLGVVLLGFQAMRYMTPKPVVTGPNQSSISQTEHKTNPAVGIIGLISLIAGGAIIATARRADEPEAKHAVK